MKNKDGAMSKNLQSKLLWLSNMHSHRSRVHQMKAITNSNTKRDNSNEMKENLQHRLTVGAIQKIRTSKRAI